MQQESFAVNEYLSWYVPRLRRHDDAINLHASGVAMLHVDPVPTSGGDPFAVFEAVERDLASWLGVPAPQVLFMPGATGGTLLALLALPRPGSEVLVEAPIYEPMLRQARRLNPVRRIHRRLEDGWQLPMDAIRGMVGPSTGMIMLTEPHNPSGVFAPREQVLEVAALAARHGAPLLINEVYLRFSERPSYHGAAENIVIVSSLSKLMGAYSARLGWLGAGARWMAALRQAHMNFGGPSAPGAAAGLEVLRRADELRARAVSLSEQGRQHVDAFMQATPSLQWVRPQGPGYGCVRLPEGVDDVAFAERLHDERGVLLVPGSMFETPGTLRLAWLGAGERLEEGLRRLGEALRG